jgi:L-asparaginase
MQPKVIIHGGAGKSVQDKGGLLPVREALGKIVYEIYDQLLEGMTATEAVVFGCHLLEDEPRFNAGTGSVLQSDGQVRMSAALMDGVKQRFSGVINISRVQHPIDLAQFLQGQSDRILSDYGAAELARELQVPIYNPLTTARLKEWVAERDQDFKAAMAGVVAASPDAGRGTIGVVVLDSEGRIAVGTSTGGKGFERIGRVSDSATPAGNYANPLAAVSCTGIGEDILEECLAAKIVVRVSDGFSLSAALEKSFLEAKNNQRDFGAIALDAQGGIGWGKTSEVLFAAYHDGAKSGDTLELTTETTTGYINH